MILMIKLLISMPAPSSTCSGMVKRGIGPITSENSARMMKSCRVHKHGFWNSNHIQWVPQPPLVKNCTMWILIFISSDNILWRTVPKTTNVNTKPLFHHVTLKMATARFSSQSRIGKKTKTNYCQLVRYTTLTSIVVLQTEIRPLVI